ATSDVVILPIEEDKAQALIDKYPYYAEDTIPEGTYDLEEDLDTVAVLAMLVVTDELSEDAVYDMTKAIYENSDDIAHAKAELISIDSALDGIGIEMHPGALKYYEEEGLEIE
ncbi:MAG TPA: TAXI family TRAP transporter solute-binding subunit, partial [Pseudogracilibacillus sp.]|nr:TAXI family TRAP transporter solute-binding subunit [Pseudogracilibacillus sp.]